MNLEHFDSNLIENVNMNLKIIDKEEWGEQNFHFHLHFVTEEKGFKNKNFFFPKNILEIPESR